MGPASRGHNNAAAFAAAAAAHGPESALESTVPEENKRTLQYIADLLNEQTREAALLELSKKREQVPELALILWNSFGTAPYLPCALRPRPGLSSHEQPLGSACLSSRPRTFLADQLTKQKKKAS